MRLLIVIAHSGWHVEGVRGSESVALDVDRRRTDPWLYYCLAIRFLVLKWGMPTFPTYSTTVLVLASVGLTLSKSPTTLVGLHQQKFLRVSVIFGSSEGLFSIALEGAVLRTGCGLGHVQAQQVLLTGYFLVKAHLTTVEAAPLLPPPLSFD